MRSRRPGEGAPPEPVARSARPSALSSLALISRAPFVSRPVSALAYIIRSQARWKPAQDPA